MAPTRRAVLTADRTEAFVGESITVTATATEAAVPLTGAAWTFAVNATEIADVSPVTTKTARTKVTGLAAGEVTLSGQTTNLVGDEVSGSVVLRFKARVPEPTPDPEPAPTPLPAETLIRFGSPIRPSSANATLPEPLASAAKLYDATFAQWGDYFWTKNGPAWEPDYGNYYDRGLAYYGMEARTGNPEYGRRGDAHAVNYRDVYLANAGPQWGSSPYWSQMWGLAIHYARTGEERSRTALVRNAQVIAQFLPEYYTKEGGDIRTIARMLEGSLLAWRLTKNGTDNPPDTGPTDWAARIDMLLATIVAFEEDGADPVRGIYPVAVTCWTTMNYQVALLMHALIHAYTVYRPSATILAQVQRAADWLWTTQWKQSANGGAGGFQYLSGGCVNVGGTDVAGDLTGMFVGAWGWLARVTGDAKYVTQGDAMFVGMTRTWYPSSGKQFNEAFATSWRYLGWRP